MQIALRTFVFLMALASGFCSSGVFAATAASRENVVNAVSRAGASSRSSSAFFGLIPGLLISDPVQSSTPVFQATTVDFGDGSPLVTYQPGETPSHIYAIPGAYQVKGVTGDSDIVTINLSFVVPFDSTVANIFAMQVSTDPNDAKAVFVTSVFDGATTGTLDFGDGSPTITIDQSVTPPSHVYANGFFNAVLTVNDGTTSRNGSASFTTPLGSGKGPQVGISGVNISPNPAKAGEEVSFSGTISVKGVSGDLTGTLDFGDGSTPFTASGSIAAQLKETIQHTYAANGVYTAILTVNGEGVSASTKAFVVVGKNTVVNSLNGVFATQEDNGGGNIGLRLTVSALAGAVNASTSYDDTIARLAPVDGLIPSRAFVVPTVAVATSTLLDAGGVPKGKIRKTIAVGARASGDSSGLADPPDTGITLSKMSGKFLFAKSTPDQISFSGTLMLPPGFDPNKTGGNPVVVGIGNIVDTVNVDAKGKPVDKSAGASQRIKKLSVKFPKLAGTAVGGEVAKVDVTLTLADMDTAGLDTEGITASLRSDEKKLKTAPRFIQVNLLLSGVAYEAYIPVQYKVSPKGDAGQIQGRASR